jgi:hypothetical protein
LRSMKACGTRPLFTHGGLRMTKQANNHITKSNINLFDMDEMVIKFP